MILHNKVLLLSALMISVIIISGCSLYKTKIVDCGQDSSCTEKNFLSCTRSRETFGGGPGALYGGVVEVMGVSPNSCLLYAEDTIATTSMGGRPINKTLTMECSVGDIKIYKENYFKFSLFDLVNANLCKGSYNDYLKQSFNNIRPVSASEAEYLNSVKT